MATALSFSSSELLALCFESVLYGMSSPRPLLLRMSPIPSSRGVPRPLDRLRQGPYQQAATKGGWERPSDLDLGLSVSTHHLGSSPPVFLHSRV
jgi:hypothetical protein